MAVPRKEQPLPKIAGPHLVSLLKSSLQRSPIQTDYHMVCFRNKTGLIVRLGGEVHISNVLVNCLDPVKSVPYGQNAYPYMDWNLTGRTLQWNLTSAFV